MTALALAKALVDWPELFIILSFEGVVRCMDPLRCLKDIGHGSNTVQIIVQKIQSLTDP